MKIKNLHLYNLTKDRMETLASEYSAAGFSISKDGDTLTVYAIAPRKPKVEKKVFKKKSEDDDRPRRKSDKR